VTELQKIHDSGGGWCSICGKVFDDVVKVRKHLFCEHYEHLKFRFDGDIEFMNKWAKDSS